MLSVASMGGNAAHTPAAAATPLHCKGSASAHNAKVLHMPLLLEVTVPAVPILHHQQMILYIKDPLVVWRCRPQVSTSFGQLHATGPHI